MALENRQPSSIREGPGGNAKRQQERWMEYCYRTNRGSFRESVWQLRLEASLPCAKCPTPHIRVRYWYAEVAFYTITNSSTPSFYFVHGLGGQGAQSWTSKPESNTDTCMWPRDVLPSYLEECHLSGRIITFGCSASIAIWRGVHQSIRKTTEEWLHEMSSVKSGTEIRCLDSLKFILTSNRSKIDQYFFACHSLGALWFAGWVICRWY